MTQETIALTDEQLEVVRRVAEERGVSVDAAATQLHSEALAALVRKGTGHAPARTYGQTITARQQGTH